MASEESIEKAELTNEGLDLAFKCANIASEHVNFFVLDIAERDEGGWILVEVNDGMMSGLSDVNPHELYSQLAKMTIL